MWGHKNEVIPGVERRPEQDELWKADARCARPDQHLPRNFFYPPKGSSLAGVQAYCAECPVRLDCLEYAIKHRERQGIWGGTSERERRRIVRERKGERRPGEQGAPTPSPGPRHHVPHTTGGDRRV
jgi:WhiB family redox-sensing transcriptional regulator